MCDRYSFTYGYICNECFDELSKCDDPFDIASFMDSPKPVLRNVWEGSLDYLKKVFQPRT